MKRARRPRDWPCVIVWASSKLVTARSSKFGILGNRVQNLLRNVIGADAFALGREIENQAMTQDRGGDRGDVVAAHVELAVEDGAGFGGEDEIQAGARASAPSEPFAAEIQCLGCFRA